MNHSNNAIVVNSSLNSRKSLLARLLARENIRVKFENTDTAHFNLKTRDLIIPIFKKEITESVYNLFLSHEIGHALHTPYDGWVQAIEETKKVIINIVEDARIEKLIKQEFPGLKPDYIFGYKTLLEDNFFGALLQEEINDMVFLDRMNIYFKCGSLIKNIQFSDEEMVFIDKAKNLLTWEHSFSLAKEIFFFLKNEKKKPKEKKKNDNTLSFEGTGGGESSDDEFKSETQNDFEEKFKDLMEKNKENVNNIYIPKLNPEHLKETIISYKHVFETLEPIYWKNMTGETLYLEYLSTHKILVNYYVQMFNILKNANELKSIQFNKTGNLDTKRIHEYMVNDDIFVRNKMVNKGKSHGLVIFLDWSVSMENNFLDSIMHLLTLTDFCRAVKIPFDVYTFTTGPSSLVKDEEICDGDLYLDPVNIVNILSHRMNGPEYVDMVQLLFSGLKKGLFSFNDSRQKTEKIQKFKNIFGMGGTPLNTTKILALSIVPEFKKMNRLEIVNTIFITDGAGSCNSSYYKLYGDTPAPYTFISGEMYVHNVQTGLSKRIDEINPEDLNSGIINKFFDQFLYENYKQMDIGNFIGFYLKDKTQNGNFEIKLNRGFDSYFHIQIKSTNFTKLLIRKIIDLIV